MVVELADFTRETCLRMSDPPRLSHLTISDILYSSLVKALSYMGG